jgi:hypothetical protein
MFISRTNTERELLFVDGMVSLLNASSSANVGRVLVSYNPSPSTKKAAAAAKRLRKTRWIIHAGAVMRACTPELQFGK